MALSSEESNDRQQPYKWSREMTKRFIQLRVQYADLFTGKRNTTKDGMQLILTELGLEDVVTEEQGKRKWENLVQKYKDIKAFAIGGEPRKPWPFFRLMDAAIRLKKCPRELEVIPVKEEEQGNEDEDKSIGEEEDEEVLLERFERRMARKRKAPSSSTDAQLMNMLKESHVEFKRALAVFQEQNTELLGLLRRLVDRECATASDSQE